MWIEELVEVKKWEWRVEKIFSLIVESEGRLFGGGICGIDVVCCVL